MPHSLMASVGNGIEREPLQVVCISLLWKLSQTTYETRLVVRTPGLFSE